MNECIVRGNQHYVNRVQLALNLDNSTYIFVHTKIKKIIIE